MGSLNQGCRDSKGHIIGVIHEKFVIDKGEDEKIEKMIVCQGNDLNERKKLLFDHSDCIIVAPGGIGTLDEMWDAACGKSLQMNGLADKPICILNIDGYYDGSIIQLQQAFKDNLLYDTPEAYFHVVNQPSEAIDWCLSEITAKRNSTALPSANIEHRMKVRDHKLDISHSKKETHTEYIMVNLHPDTYKYLYFFSGLLIGYLGTVAAKRY